MSTFTDDELLNKSTRLMSTKVRFFFHSNDAAALGQKTYHKTDRTQP